jgi:hypothetical protein
MNGTTLLQWHYLIFLLPFGLAAFLLLLSSLRLGHRHGGHGRVAAHSGHGGHGAHATAGPAHTHGAHGGHSGHGAATARHGGTGKGGHGKANGRSSREAGATPANVFLALMGVDRAPLPMVVESFCICWGLIGCLANQWLLPRGLEPTLFQMLPSLGIALGGGLIGARGAAELIARLMPQDESQVVSRDGLFGMVGKVAFPVSATGGRIHIYDEFGTLHDETCRVAPAYPSIAKGCRAMVMDRDAQGNLIVEEVPD